MSHKPTLSEAIHANQNTSETMTQCLHRMKDTDETMTSEIHDMQDAINNPPVTSPTEDVADDIYEEVTILKSLDSFADKDALEAYGITLGIDLNKSMKLENMYKKLQDFIQG